MTELSELAKKYKQAEELVFKRYSTETGEKGQPLSWKIAAIAQDRAAGRENTSVLNDFVNDVEKEVDKLLAVKSNPTEQFSEGLDSIKTPVKITPC